MRIGMLGPLQVRADDGAAVEVPGARLRALLIVLALEPGRVVSTSRLVDGIWGDEPPAGAPNALQALVTRLRRVLSDVAVESHPAGYRLAVEPDMVDVARFERLVASGPCQDAGSAARTLRAALALWRGPALPEVAGTEHFLPMVARLTDLRLTAVEDLAAAEFGLGEAGGSITELSSLVAEHPLRERLVASLMRALCAVGRPADALACYERTRRALAESLGADPSAELSALHTAVLRGQLPAQPETTVDTRPRTNLRAALTSFVGRDEDVTEVGGLVGEYRLTTLTGPGGSGKTRLSIETARTLLDHVPDGVWLVELASLGSETEAAQAILAALGIQEQALVGGAVVSPVERLVAALSGRNALLVLDNCEHMIDAAATLADRLLGECPRLRILATSREPLGITGEAVRPVAPLALPPLEPPSAVDVASYAAIRLWVDRARAARPGFTPTGDNLPTVVRICRALDGMPLAIELAAARLRTMTVEQVATQLADRFRLLTGGSRTVLPRHRTLRAVVDWSWDLLSDQERALLRRLAVFAGGATTAAAEQVCADETVAAEQVFELLNALTDKSLLIAATEGPPRYRMLETIRAYGVERLTEAGERDRFRVAHARYFAELVETADPHLRRAEQLVWLDRLTADHDNINSALRGAIAAGEAPMAARLVAAAGWYWWLRGHRAEGAALAAAALTVPGVVDNEVRATACAMSVWLATAGLGSDGETQDRLREARESGAGRRNPLVRLIVTVTADGPLLTDEDPWVRGAARMTRARVLLNTGRRHADAEADIRAALAEFRAVGERWGMSFALSSLADLVAARGDVGAALAHHEEAIALVVEVADNADAMQMRLRLAQLRWLLGDAEGARSAMAEVERYAERLGWPDGLAVVAHAAADLSRWAGDVPAARAHLARAEPMSKDVGVNMYFRAMVLGSQGYLDALEGDLASARAHHAEALDWALRSQDAPLIGRTLAGVADLALHRGRPREAALLLAAGDAVRGAPDLSLPDGVRVAAAVRVVLGERDLAEAERDGGAATVATVRDVAASTLAIPEPVRP